MACADCRRACGERVAVGRGLTFPPEIPSKCNAEMDGNEHANDEVLRDLDGNRGLEPGGLNVGLTPWLSRGSPQLSAPSIGTFSDQGTWVGVLSQT